jgi:8-oxo-dGTP pyrophosphatase MutT (NUDIX family)
MREHEGEVQVLMARRHAALAFMGGMWVFPGGTLTAADSDAARGLLAGSDRCSFELHGIDGGTLPRPTSIALAIAACRETFEEAGILLAKRKDGQQPHVDQLERLHNERARLTANPMRFMAAIANEGLVLDVEDFVYWSHWITPSGVTSRFDTRFFATRAPLAHTPVADTHETSECIWMSPTQLLDNAAADTMPIAQPTRYTLEDLRVSLARHGTLDALLQAERSRRVAAIVPKLFVEKGRTIVVMPWDPDYDSVPGEGGRPGQYSGQHPGQYYEPALLALPSRVER